MVENDIKRRSAILVGLNIDKTAERFELSMAELAELAAACDIDVVGTVTQNADSVNKATFIGSGKTQDLKVMAEGIQPDLIIFNETLAPLQVRNLDKILDVEIMDRTGLILEIFSMRARTREARLQVESARLAYTLPRLAGMRNELGRQGGTSGSMSNRGAGEKKIELDRRYIEKRISEIDRELKQVDKERDIQRSKRLNSGELKCALVGYTNAGKSTLMNSLLDIDKKVFEADMLFATLDTSVRRIDNGIIRPFMLIDTVGFIDDLPHSLVKAFRSTLEEVKYADLILEIIDYSDPDYRNHMEVTKKTLAEIGAGAIPVLYIYNKYDKVLEGAREDLVISADDEIPVVREDSIYMSARTRQGLEELLGLIDDFRRQGELEWIGLIPYTRGDILNILKNSATILSTEYLAEGTKVELRTTVADYKKYREYELVEQE